MRQNDINNLPKLDFENFENIFSVYQDNNDYYYYNLLETIFFPNNLPESYFSEYTVKYEDTWPLISYKAYGTIKLWWVIAYANNVINPINFLEVGKKIKIPKTSIVTEILTDLNTNRNNG
jgi:nucleoid-associated protein YgaU